MTADAGRTLDCKDVFSPEYAAGSKTSADRLLGSPDQPAQGRLAANMINRCLKRAIRGARIDHTHELQLELWLGQPDHGCRMLQFFV